ncbi:hypothetical protein SAMN06297144_1853 [Sphingomonas guangdongensis]|uniref:Uncharacterized protein n=1 Tax=Sphingomonas guangdongensis TaxID=1141890 RepID=A0A285QYV3_9SPHN|nr:hypothetical protein [Sphingomonas guangdongensis]SOB86744.1 hypothetical protein SAMN06297144_1853 [Sphingomonas guangdongensis]
MASIVDFGRNSLTHLKSATIGAAVGVPSSLIGIFDRFSPLQGYFLAMFGLIAAATVWWIKRQPFLTDRQTGSALSWLVGSITGFVVCLILPLITPPSSAQTYNASNDPNPCVKAVAFGFKCSSESLGEALYSGNETIIKLLVSGGVRIEPLDNINGFRAGAVKMYVDALSASNKLNDLAKECLSAQTASTAYGCSIIEQTEKVTCALEDTLDTDRTFQAYIDQDSRKFSEDKAKEFPTLVSNCSFAPDQLPIKSAATIYSELRECYYSGHFALTCEKHASNKLCARRKRGLGDADQQQFAEQARRVRASEMKRRPDCSRYTT